MSAYRKMPDHAGWPAGDDPHQVSPGGLDLARVAVILLRRWWLVLAATVVVGGAAWLLVPADRIVFASTAVVRLTDPTPRLTGGLVGPFGEAMQSTEFMTSQIHVLRSRTVIGEVVDQAGLRLVPDADLPAELIGDIRLPDAGAPERIDLVFDGSGFLARAGGAEGRSAYGEPVRVGGVEFSVSRNPGVTEAGIAVLSREDAIDLVLLGLVASQRERSSILDIVQRDADPHRARVTVNELARTFQRQNAKTVQEVIRRRREFIEEQSLQAEAQLARAQQDLVSFRSRSGQVDLNRFATERAELAALESQRDAIQAEFRLYSSFLERVERARGAEVDEELRTFMAALGAGAGPILSQLYAQFSGFQGERDGMLAAGRAATHPDVERLTTLIASTRTSVVDAARTQLSSVRLRLAAVEDQRSRLAASSRALPDFESEDARLINEVEVARATMQALRTEYQRARMAETVELGQVDVLDFALGALPQREGNRPRSLVIAIVLGFLLGSGGALLLETTDTRVRRRFDAEALMSAPPLAVIPPVGDPGPRRIGAGRLLPASNGASAGLVTSGDNLRSVASEAYRLLRTNLIFIDRAEDMRTLVVTSSLAGEGKTTTAANLAVTFAQQGLRVLLVDCDLRRPGVHPLFGLRREPGLSDVLLARGNPRNAVQETHVPGLSVLAAGRAPEVSATDLLSGEAIRSLIEELTPEFDLVLLDTPPVLVTANAAILSTQADGVLLVLRAGRTEREEGRLALQQLMVVGANVVGAVLNDPDSLVLRQVKYREDPEPVHA
jgi:capsular exopolysaccharide synthesis family protein